MFRVPRSSVPRPIGDAVPLYIALAHAVRQDRRDPSTSEELAGAVQALRHASADEARYRHFTTEDAELLEPRQHYEAAVRELDAHGFTMLGDKVEVRADGTAAGVSRWFVDGNRTVCGWFGVIRGHTINPVMLLFSESDAGSFFATLRGGSTLSVAQPPTVHKAYCEWGEGLARQLEHHHALLSQASNAGAATLRRVQSIDDAVGSVIRLRQSVTAWRARQSPTFLLNQDVRSVLEDRFEEVGPELIEFMGSAAARTSAG